MFDMFFSHMYLTAFIVIGLCIIAAAIFFGEGKNKYLVIFTAIVGGILAAFGATKVQEAKDRSQTKEKIKEIDAQMKEKDEELKANQEEIERIKKEKEKLDKQVKELETRKETVETTLEEKLEQAEEIKPVEVKPEEAHEFLQERVEKQRKKRTKKQ